MRSVSVMLALLAMAAGMTGGFRIAHERSVDHAARELTGGFPELGRDLISAYGCIACHEVPGFTGIKAQVGPPLAGIGGRTFVAGVAENTPDTLQRFLRDPRSVAPQSAMPKLGVSAADARDLAAYLYTLQ